MTIPTPSPVASTVHRRRRRELCTRTGTARPRRAAAYRLHTVASRRKCLPDSRCFLSQPAVINSTRPARRHTHIHAKALVFTFRFGAHDKDRPSLALRLLQFVLKLLRHRLLEFDVRELFGSVHAHRIAVQLVQVNRQLAGLLDH